MTRKFLLLAAGLAMSLATVVAVPTPASAQTQTCAVGTQTNPSTGRSYSPQHHSTIVSQGIVTGYVNRQGCVVVSVEGTPSQYRFRIRVQDLIDWCYGCLWPTTAFDGDGISFVNWGKYRQTAGAPGSSGPGQPGNVTWNYNIVWDAVTDNKFNQSNNTYTWTTPWLSANAGDGWPQDHRWQFGLQSHWREGPFNHRWQWNYSSTWSVVH